MEQAQSTLPYQKQAIESLGIPVPNSPNSLLMDGAVSRFIYAFQTNGGIQRLRQNYEQIVRNHSGNGTRVHSLANLHLSTSFASLLEKDLAQSEIALANFWELMQLDALVGYMKRDISGGIKLESLDKEEVASELRAVGHPGLSDLKDTVRREFVVINSSNGHASPYRSLGLVNITGAYELMRHPTDEPLREEAKQHLENGLLTTGYMHLLLRTLSGMQGVTQNPPSPQSRLEQAARKS